MAGGVGEVGGGVPQSHLPARNRGAVHCTRAEPEEKLARRLHDAKMQRLDNGDKLKRRKSPFRAACRTYEAIIDLNEAQLKCAWTRCKAAEAERDAARAELRLDELA